ncbi:hypothetical protein [Streptomyces cyaneochromogenes]|uniref:hypothetical protein n=1 Tax=Streptomyces cyaneochromogenes TaxID=2496836 RepID=UPI001589611B|nr:hypothetical protein [Streptomyces cyaneochromogenes]
MRHDGVTAFVELGPGEVLSRVLDACLPQGDDRPIVLCVARNRHAQGRRADVA